MLSLWTNRDPASNRPCRPTGLPRREVLRAGALGWAGLSLADLLRAEAATGGATRRPKSVIYIVLGGGPSHLDIWDLKPDAPAEIRGEFQPIATGLPGESLCELLPRQAENLHRWALLRGVRSVENDHYLSEVYTGLPRSAGQRPAFGSIASRHFGAAGGHFGAAGGHFGAASPLPPYVALNDPTTEVFEFERPHYAGAAHGPFRPTGQGLADLRLNQPLERLGERRELLAAFDNLRRQLDRAAQLGAAESPLDPFAQRALEMLAAPAVAEAFDVSQEPPETLARYGRGKFRYISVDYNYDWDPRPFILARRLVEAGVRVVTLRLDGWDHHSGLPGSIFDCLRTVLPLLDASLHALTSDLAERGLADDVLVTVLGEFGRTPKINSPGPGREHWADAGCVLFSGGGLQMGQVIGATDRHGERSTTGDISLQNVLATIYHVLGIDPASQLISFAGRPQSLLDDPRPIAALQPPGEVAPLARINEPEA